MPDLLIHKYFYPAVAKWLDMNLEHVEEISDEMSENEILDYLEDHFSSYKEFIDDDNFKNDFIWSVDAAGFHSDQLATTQEISEYIQENEFSFEEVVKHYQKLITQEETNDTFKKAVQKKLEPEEIPEPEETPDPEEIPEPIQDPEDFESIQDPDLEPEPVDNYYPTDYEQYMITLINRARLDPEAEADIFGIDLNQGISPQGEISADMKQPLAFNPDLTKAAREHSQWMIDKNTFGHTGEGNSSPGDRIEDTDYNTEPPWGWAENLAWKGSSASLDDYTHFIADQHESLFHSPGHRKNTMNEGFSEVGAGSLLGEYDNTTGLMTTIKFAHTSDTPFVTGTVFQDFDDSGTYKPGEGVGNVQIQAGEQSTSTWDSGGYSMQLEPGEYLLTFDHEKIEEKVEIDFTTPSENVLVDLVLEPDDQEPDPPVFYQNEQLEAYDSAPGDQEIFPLGVSESVNHELMVHA